MMFWHVENVEQSLGSGPDLVSILHHCVLAVFMTCVTWIVVEIVTLELVAVMRHSVEV